jgi:hypothetical protein
MKNVPTENTGKVFTDIKTFIFICLCRIDGSLGISLKFNDTPKCLKYDKNFPQIGFRVVSLS